MAYGRARNCSVSFLPVALVRRLRRRAPLSLIADARVVEGARHKAHWRSQDIAGMQSWELTFVWFVQRFDLQLVYVSEIVDVG